MEQTVDAHISPDEKCLSSSFLFKQESKDRMLVSHVQTRGMRKLGAKECAKQRPSLSLSSYVCCMREVEVRPKRRVGMFCAARCTKNRRQLERCEVMKPLSDVGDGRQCAGTPGAEPQLLRSCSFAFCCAESSFNGANCVPSCLWWRCCCGPSVGMLRV